MGAAERINAVRGAELAARAADRVDEVVAQINAVTAVVDFLRTRVREDGEDRKQVWKLLREHEARLDAHTESLNRGVWARLVWLVTGR